MTRTAVIAYLGTCGGDVHHRERLEAEAHARVELEVELRAQRQRIAFELRGRLHASLIAHGADPDLRARLLAEAVGVANERAARQAEMDAEAMRRSQIAAADATRRAEIAAAEAARRATLVAEVRGRVSATLIANGAVLRPPMPDVPYQEQGIPPASGAVWVAGTWHWSGVRWEWSEGAWLGGPGVDVGVAIGGGGATISYDPPAVYVPTYQAPAYTPPPSPEPRPQVRDHRTPATVVVPPAQPAPPPPAPTPASPARPKVRDHRDRH